jgi:hypothetical protein
MNIQIRSIEKSNDLIGTRTCDLPACSIVSQPTTLPGAPNEHSSGYKDAFLHNNITAYLGAFL